jgi:hypothetical protein
MDNRATCLQWARNGSEVLNGTKKLLASQLTAWDQERLPVQALQEKVCSK